MIELSKLARALIRALLKAPRAWQTPGELARAVGADPDEATDCVADLDADGWLVAWDGAEGSGPAVTLSPAAAARLGARLVEYGPRGTTRWATRDQADPPPPRALDVFRGERAAMLDLLVDPQPEPSLALDAAEAAEAHLATPPPAPQRSAPGRAGRASHWPRPMLLIGTGTTPWPGPEVPENSGACPACEGLPLRATSYCLRCDRWGLDHRLADLVASEPTPELVLTPDRRPPSQVQAQRDREIQARKAKRRARQVAADAAQKLKDRNARRAGSPGGKWTAPGPDRRPGAPAEAPQRTKLGQ